MALRRREAAASVPSPLQFTSGVSQEQQRPVKNRKDLHNHRHHHLSGRRLCTFERTAQGSLPWRSTNTPAVSRRSKTRISAARGNPPTNTKKSDARGQIRPNRRRI